MNSSLARMINWPISLLVTWLLMFWTNVFLTWPLWSKTNNFPWIPFTERFVNIPYQLDPILLVILFVLHLTLLTAFIRNVNYVYLVYLLISCSILLVLIGLLNIGRFQPWVWQSVLIPFLTALQIVLCLKYQKFQAFDQRQFILQICQYLTISIYFFSATSKLNESYSHGIGSEFIGMINSIVPIDAWCSLFLPAKFISDFQLWLIVLSELQIALCLYFRQTRVLGYVWSILMHLSLLVILGPYGAKQELPVLVWNIYFIIQNSLIICWQLRMFSAPRDLSQTVLHISKVASRIPEVKTAVLIVLMLPMLYWFNCYDPWLGWALYSTPATEITMIMSNNTMMENPDIPHLTSKSNFGSEIVILQQHCLKQNHAPLLPAEHYQLAVTYWFLSHFSVHDIPINTDIKRNYAAYKPYRASGYLSNNLKETMTEIEQIFQKSGWSLKARTPE